MDKKSLIYTINEINRLPFYIGRINLIDLDPVFSFQYKYYLKNSSSDIAIDSITGSIILLNKLNREKLQYEIIVMDSSNQKNITDILIININNSNLFEKDIYQLNIYQCFLDENQLNGTKICTIGKDSIDFIYHLIDPMNFFDILPNNGTIINRKIFDYETDKHEFNVTITVRDRKEQVLKIFIFYPKEK